MALLTRNAVVEKFRSMSKGDLEALLATNDLSVKIKELSVPRPPSGLRLKNWRQFRLTVFNVDRYVAADQVNAAARIVERELSEFRNGLIVALGREAYPPQIHLEQELLQRMLFTANR